MSVREETLFREVLSKPANERLTFLERTCAGQPELRAAIEALLAAHEASGGTPNQPPPEVGQSVDAVRGEKQLDEPLRTTDHVSAPVTEAPANALTTDELPAPEAGNATVSFQPGKGRPRGDSAPPPAIAGYEIEAVLGRGGMGVVYKARQLALKRTVALKMILAGGHAGPRELARFRIEAEAVARLQHPNIVQVFEVGEADGHPYCALEFVEGGNLAGMIEGKPMPAREAARLVEALARAMQLAHSRNVVHRDLKPANVLVAADGTPKITDFGLARQLDSDSGETQAGAVMGTPSYMAPEQASGRAHDAGPAADTYALGAILYDCLTGRPPFKGKTIVETLDQVRHQEPALPSRLQPGVPPDLETVCLKCLRKEPEQRYASAAELADDLGRYQRGEPITARPVGHVERAAKWVRRNPVLAAAAAAVVLALVGGIIGTSTGMVTAQSARADEKTQREKAEGLADEKGKLAEEKSNLADEKSALAIKNGKLADAEREAKNQEIAAKQETERQLLRAQAILFTSQVDQARRVYDKDPIQALRLITNMDICPVEQRDLAWHFLDNASKNYRGLRFPLQGTLWSVSPDGKWLVAIETVSRYEEQEGVPRRRIQKHISSTIRVVEAATGQVHALLPKFSESIGAVSFSPDGNRLAVVVYQGPDVILGPTNPDDKPVAVPNTIQLWDLAGVKNVATLEGHADTIHTLISSPDGKLLFSGAQDGTARLWDLTTGKKRHDLADLGKGLRVAAFSPDGKRLFTCGQDDTARLWDPLTGKKLHDLADFGKEFRVYAFSPDGKRLATGGMDNRIKLWDVENGKLVATWTPASNPDPALAAFRNRPDLQGRDLRDGVVALDFSPDGHSLVSGNANWLIEIRDTDTGTVRLTLRDVKAPQQWARFARDGKSVVVAAEGTVIPRAPRAVSRWDAETGQSLLFLPLFVFGVGGASGSLPTFCQEANLVVVPGYANYEIVRLDVTLERARLEAEKVTGSRSAAVFSRAGDVLAVGAGDRIGLWDVKTGKLRHTLRGHKKAVYGLALSPDGHTLASCAAYPTFGLPDGKPNAEPDDIRLWDINTGEALGTIPVGVEKTLALAFSPDGSTLAALYWAKKKEDDQPKPPPGQITIQPGILTVTLWDMKTKEPRFSHEHTKAGDFRLMRDDRGDLAFHPADGSLVSACGRSLCFWDTANGELRRQTLLGAEGHGGGGGSKVLLESVAFSPDGKLLVANYWGQGVEHDGVMAFWNVATGELLKKVGNTGVGRLAFSRDGKNLVSASKTSVVIWDALTHQQRLSFTAHGLGEAALALSPDGQTLATAVIVGEKQPGSLQLDYTGPVEVKLWDVSHSPTVLTFWGRNLATNLTSGLEVMFGRDQTLIEPDNSGVIRLWDLEKRRVRATIDTTRYSIGVSAKTSVVSPTRRYLAGHDVVGTEEQKAGVFHNAPGTNELPTQVNLLDTTTGTVREIRMGKGPIRDMIFSADESRLAILHHMTRTDVRPVRQEYTVEILNLHTEKCEQTIPLPSAITVPRMAFSPDGATLAVETVRRPDKPMPPPGPGSITSVQILDVQSGTVLTQLNHDASQERRLWFTQNGERLVVQSLNPWRPSSIWDWRAGKQVDEPIPEAPAVNARVSSDGRYELRNVTGAIEVIDRTVKPSAVMSRRHLSETALDK